MSNYELYSYLNHFFFFSRLRDFKKEKKVKKLTEKVLARIFGSVNIVNCSHVLLNFLPFPTTYILSLSLVTHSSAFIFSLASSRDVKDVATLKVGWNALNLCFCTSIGSLNGPYNNSKSFKKYMYPLTLSLCEINRRKNIYLY